jgi:hypothetical protein
MMEEGSIGSEIKSPTDKILDFQIKNSVSQAKVERALIETEV